MDTKVLFETTLLFQPFRQKLPIDHALSESKKNLLPKIVESHSCDPFQIS